MASLDPPFNSLTLGVHRLQGSALFVWSTIGSCTVTANAPYEFACSGTFNILNHAGSFDLNIKLTDKNPAAASGPCELTNAGQIVTGTYTRSGSTLTFTSGAHTVVASPDGSNVVIELSGYPKIRIVA